MKKIPVMIVDDEKLVLEDLRTLVDWEVLGFKIVATAFNGKQAWLKFNEYHPRVIFTDVKMPFMNGLELLKRIREADSEAVLFLLTAYEDFSYARTAIQYGIRDYVIKSTLDETVFTQLLKKLRESLEEHGRVKELVKEKAVSEFMESQEDQVSDLPDVMAAKAYSYLLIEQDLPLEFADHAVDDGFLCSRKEMIRIIISEKPAEYETMAAHTGEGRLLIILDIPDSSQQRTTDILYAYACRLLRRLEEHFQRSFTIYMPDHKMRLLELKQFERKASESFFEKYFLGGGRVLSISECRTAESPAGGHTASQIRELQELVEKRDQRSVITWLRDNYSLIEQNRDYFGLKSMSRELFDLLKRLRGQIPEYIGNKAPDPAKNYEEWFDSSHIEKWFERHYTDLVSDLEKMHGNQYSRPTRKAMEYISKNYQKHDLTIKEIAESVRLSSGHLCAMFKKETGKTLNSYITEVRIDRAKQLLEEGELKIYEISTEVGYQSSQYFSQIFYKVAGVYPTDYQKGKGRKS